MNLTPKRKVSRRLLLALSCGLAAVPVVRSQTATPPAAPAAEKKSVPVEKTDLNKADDQVVLSPFVVTTSKDSGYYAENTLAGSRLNSNLADLAASITVVTKQQLDDTASLGINDVFRYEASTEGSSTFAPSIIDRGTAKDAIGGYTDSAGNSTTNAQSNRVRGLAAPNASINYFPTNNRVPFDSYNTQSVEISRGPNSLLFGLGSPAGIVNQTAAQAEINKNTGQFQVRTDQNGSFRTSLSFNRSLIEDKLSIFGAVLYDNEQFERKPSGDLTRRQYASFTYKPFKKTVIRGFAENFKENANRPNTFTPRDWVTPWIAAGRPSYDPITRTVTNLASGAVSTPYVQNLLSPGAVAGSVLGSAAPSSYFLTTTPPNSTPNPQFQPGLIFEDTTRPLRFIDGNGNTVAYYQRQPVLYAPAQTNPATSTPTPVSLGWVANDPRYAILDRQWSTSSLNYPTVRLNPALPSQVYPVINGVPYGSYQNPGVTDQSIYDWTKYNTIQSNFATYHASHYNLEFEQQITSNLFFSAGWLRQDIDSTENYTLGALTGNTLSIDTNSRLINGNPNPYFGLPMIGEGQGGGMDTFYAPETDDNFRAMLAYDVDFTRQPNWMKWLGRHRLLGLWARQNVHKQVERWRNGFVDGDADAKLRYVPNFAVGGTQAALNGLTLERKYYLADPGDPQATVTHSAGFYGNKGWDVANPAQIEVYNYTTGQFQKDSVVEQALFSSAGSLSTQREVKSWTLATQSYLWNERLVATLGWRHDDYRARITTVGTLTDVTGKVTAPALTNAQLYTNGFTGLINHDVVMSRWGRWDSLSGDTKTVGLAFRPFKDWASIDRSAAAGNFGADFLRNVTFYFNKSDNFNPPDTYQTDYFNKPLPKPIGNGKDFGIGIQLLDNKLVARVNWYETTSTNERTAAAATLLGRLAYSDTTTGLAWASAVQRIRNGANTAVANWNTEGVNPLADAVNQQKIYDLIKLPLNYYSGTSIAGTQDSKAKGMEFQLTYNPVKNWTIKVTADKQKTSYKNVVPQYDAWLAVRLPVWQSLGVSDIPDFTDGGGVHYSLKNFWSGYGFTNVARDTDATGNTSPQAYFNNVVVSQIATAKALEGADAADQRKYHATLLTNYTFITGKLTGFSVGGAQRWESKAAIGYLGKASDPNFPTLINIADVTRPVYDSGNYYTDLWLSYYRKIWSNRIGLKVQLNVNNVFEGGRLQPTAVNFDGKPYAFRIIDPRQFILTTTFSF